MFDAESAAAPAIDLKELHTKIGQLALENDFSGRRAQQGRHAERRAIESTEIVHCR